MTVDLQRESITVKEKWLYKYVCVTLCITWGKVMDKLVDTPQSKKLIKYRD